MAALSQAEREKIFRVFMRRKFPAGATYTKADLMAAVAAADTWADANAAAYNAALPNPFRTAATASEKAVVLALVALARAGNLDDVG